MDRTTLVHNLRALIASTDVGHLSLEASLDDMLVRVSTVFQADRVELFLLDENNELCSAGAWVEQTREWDNIPTQLIVGPAADAMAAGSPVPAPEVAGSEGDVRAVLAIPITVRSVKVGAMNIYRTEVRDWWEEEVQAGLAFAALLGLLMMIAESAYLHPRVSEVDRMIREQRTIHNTRFSEKRACHAG